MQGDEVSHQDQVEQLGQVALTLTADLDHIGHDLAKQLRDVFDTPHHLGVLGVVTEIHEGNQLARDVAVLAPTGYLVVAELGEDAVERGDLAFSFTCVFHRSAAVAPSE